MYTGVGIVDVGINLTGNVRGPWSLPLIAVVATYVHGYVTTCGLLWDFIGVCSLQNSVDSKEVQTSKCIVQ